MSDEGKAGVSYQYVWKSEQPIYGFWGLSSGNHQAYVASAISFGQPFYLLVYLLVTHSCAYLFRGRVSFLTDCPAMHCIVQAGIKFTELHLPLPPDCWD